MRERMCMRVNIMYCDPLCQGKASCVSHRQIATHESQAATYSESWDLCHRKGEERREEARSTGQNRTLERSIKTGPYSQSGETRVVVEQLHLLWW